MRIHNTRHQMMLWLRLGTNDVTNKVNGVNLGQVTRNNSEIIYMVYDYVVYERPIILISSMVILFFIVHQQL